MLHDISFRVQPGQSIALLGSTGSGKTSLVNLLPRFYEYTSGRITLDGVDIKDISREYLRGQIGIVEQEPFLFSRTIRENITYGVGREVSDAEVEAAARAADVHEVMLSFPEGYKTMVGERGVTLSGGQKQRVAIARTLLKNPPILILDNSTSSVDTETEANIREALDHLMANRTTFIIAHRIQSVMNADLILVLDKGRDRPARHARRRWSTNPAFTSRSTICKHGSKPNWKRKSPVSRLQLRRRRIQRQVQRARAAAHHGAGQAPLADGGGFLFSVAVVSLLNSYFTYLGKRIVDEGISAGQPRRADQHRDRLRRCC